MDCFRWEFYCWKCPRYLTKEEKGGSFHCKRFVCCFAFFTLVIAMALRILNMGLMRINENYCKWYLFICASSRVQVFSMQGRGISFGRNSNAILWTIIGSLHYHRQHNGHCIRWRWGLRHPLPSKAFIVCLALVHISQLSYYAILCDTFCPLFFPGFIVDITDSMLLSHSLYNDSFVVGSIWV